MSTDTQLRAQSQLLLEKLKSRQAKLQNDIGYHDNRSDVYSNTYVKTHTGHSKGSRDDTRHLDVSTTAVKQLDERIRQEIKQKLTDLNRKEVSKPINVNAEVDDINMVKSWQVKHELPEKQVFVTDLPEDKRKVMKGRDAVCSEAKQKDSCTKQNNHQRLRQGSPHSAAVTQNRKIIDRNVKVDSKLTDDESIREDPKSRLNFSYSKFDESDINYLRSSLGQTPVEEFEMGELDAEDDETEHRKEHSVLKDKYKGQLHAAGNDRKVANLIRDTMSKPKSILLTSGPKALKKSLSKVSFLSSRNTSTDNSAAGMSSLGKKQDHHLLGYDWIAALLDNGQGLGDRSEDYFEELREFRRINRDECVNAFYMQGTVDGMLENRHQEPEPVAEALQETKVKPYTVNDRLFTEPLKKPILGPYHCDTEEQESEKPSKPPTVEEPRFVRVSIPRSTLLSPHRVKPHRRKSLEDTDSFALSTHCIKGYENSVPSMMPAASNVGLRDSSLGIKSKIQTTLADAEMVAASFPYPWTSSNTNNLRPPPSESASLQRSYRDMTLPTTMQSQVERKTENTQALKQATDDLLNSTYSLMFELDQIKQQRETLSNRQTGVV